MKITPLEIRQKQFEKVFRGYDKDEVEAFLMSLSQEWERVLEQQRDLKLKLDNAEKEVEKLREVETSLFKTLKTAEDTGANMIEQANRSAELHVREAHLKADSLLNEARNEARTIVEDAQHEARQIVEEMEAELKALAQRNKQMEDVRENLLSDLTSLAQNVLQKVEKATTGNKQKVPDALMQKAKDLSHHMKSMHPRQNTSYENEPLVNPAPVSNRVEQKNKPEEQRPVAPAPKPEPKEDSPVQPPKKHENQGSKGGSFFDEIE